MGLFDFFKSELKDSNVIHLKNLLLVASADSDVRDVEVSVIATIMERMGLSEEKFQYALSELITENKIRRVGSKMCHTGNVLNIIEVIKTDSMSEKLKYLQDYVLVMMSDGSIDNREKQLCEAIAKKMGMPSGSVDIVIQMVINKTGWKEQQNSTHIPNENQVSSKARNAYRAIVQQADSISDSFQELDSEGLCEAKIFCVVMTIVYNDNIDDNTKQELLTLLLFDVVKTSGMTKNEVVALFDNRLPFYEGEINKFTQPTYSCMAIYNTLYCNPLTESPDDLSDVDADPMSLMMLYSTIVQIANNVASI